MYCMHVWWVVVYTVVNTVRTVDTCILLRSQEPVHMRPETYDIHGICGSFLGDIGTSGRLIVFQHVLLADVHLACTCIV